MRQHTLVYITMVSFVFPVLAGLMHWETLSRYMKLFFFYTILSLVISVVEIMTAEMRVHNLFIVNIAIVIEFSFFMVFYYLLTVRTIQRWMYGIFGVLVYGVYIAGFMSPDKDIMFNTNLGSVERLCLIVMMVVYLYDIYNHSSIPLAQLFSFWIAIGIIVYSGGTLFIVMLGKELGSLNLHVFHILWRINFVFVMIENLFFAKGLLCRYQ